MVKSPQDPPLRGLELVARYATRLSDIDIPKARVPPNMWFQQLRDGFAEQIESALNRSMVSDRERQAVQYALGTKGDKGRPHQALMSHMPMRKHAGELLYRQLHPIWQADGGAGWTFRTFITDLGNTGELRPIIELARLKRDASKMLDRVGLDAIGVIELQMARYPMKGLARTVQAHLHLICRPGELHLSTKALEKRIADSRTFTNWLGAPTATFKVINSAENLAFWCDYMFKAPLEESWLVRNSKMRSGYETKSEGTIDRFGALRLAELLACLELRSACVAHGSLVKAKGDWHRAVNQWLWARPSRLDPDVAGAFQRVWAGSSRTRRREPPVIRLNASLPIDPAWAYSMVRWFEKVAVNRLRYDTRQAERRRHSG